jgi:hypothetical protein
MSIWRRPCYGTALRQRRARGIKHRSPVFRPLGQTVAAWTSPVLAGTTCYRAARRGRPSVGRGYEDREARYARRGHAASSGRPPVRQPRPVRPLTGRGRSSSARTVSSRVDDIESPAHVEVDEVGEPLPAAATDGSSLFASATVPGGSPIRQPPAGRRVSGWPAGDLRWWF